MRQLYIQRVCSWRWTSCRHATIEFSADAAFDGAVSDILLNLETAACLDAGTHYLWLEPQNADGVPGPINAPLTIEVI